MEIKRTFGMSFGLRMVTIAVMLIASTVSLSAQRIALTTNLLEDAVLTPNFGIDIAVADRQSISFDLSCSPWKLSPQFFNKSMTFRELYTAYYEYQEEFVKATTLKTYRDRIVYMKMLDNVKLVDLNATHYEKWRKELSKRTDMSTGYKNQISNQFNLLCQFT